MKNFRELSWSDVKKVKELIQHQHQNRDLDEIAGMVYLLSDADCVDIVTKKIKEISKFDSFQLVLDSIYDTLPSSVQKRILGQILANRQAIMIVEKLYKNRTGNINEDIVKLWSGLSVIANYINNPNILDYNQVSDSMDFIVNYFSQIKEKAKGITDFNNARLVVIEIIRETFGIIRRQPEYLSLIHISEPTRH